MQAIVVPRQRLGTAGGVFTFESTVLISKVY